MMRTHRFLLSTFVVSLAFPLQGLSEELAAGSPTAANVRDGAEAERVVSEITRLAEESRRGAPQFSMIGEVTGGGNSWWVNGEEFFLDSATVVTGELKAGRTVEVRGLRMRGQPLTARHVTVFPESKDHNAPGRGISAAEARALR
ncbi:MAG: hypothetical protein RL417_1340 [Pseudomonadota bacterium]|jgi:hypothetical protein